MKYFFFVISDSNSISLKYYPLSYEYFLIRMLEEYKQKVKLGMAYSL